jgi:hypothetical protein
MALNPRLVTVGTISGGSTAIQADVTSLGSDVAVAVTLTTDYAMLHPPGFPFRASFTGAAVPQYPHIVTSGTTIKVLRCEATALVNAGAGTLT